MVSPELAEKLEKRLQAEKNEEEDDANGKKEAVIPEAPVIPKKIVENPFVTKADISIDDLIFKMIGEDNNSNDSKQKAVETNKEMEAAQVRGRTENSRNLPPKLSIQELLEKERQIAEEAAKQETPRPKTPTMIISKGAFSRSESPRRQQFVKIGDDGSELEKRLAAQRIKKYSEDLDIKKPLDPLDELMNSAFPGPAKIKSKESIEEEERRNDELEDTRQFEELEKQITDDFIPPPPPSLPTLPPIESIPPPPPPSICPPAVPSPPPSPRPKCAPPECPKEAEKEESAAPSDPEPRVKSPPPIPPKKPSLTGTPLAARRALTSPIPTPQLIELIQKEERYSQSPSTSRPQSPNIHGSMERLINSPPPVAPKPARTATPPISEKELSEALERRAKIAEGENVPLRVNKKLSLYAEFNEFSRKQIQHFTETFKKYDEDNDNYIDFNELKRMMEKLGEAQTHIALKELIKKVDEDQDGKISQREFLLIFRLAASGQLECSEVFKTIADSVDVSKEGVLGAANFFQAKIAEQTKMSRFEEEMLQEKEERKRAEEEKRERREKFLASKSIFH